MDLFELLKQFKNIQPDPAFKETSKRAILAFEPREGFTGSRVRHTFFRIIETGVAVALTGFFVLLITGAFSGTGLAPRYSAINPQSLRAEAQAIDIQIQLANLSYAATPSAESTAPTAGIKNSTGTVGNAITNGAMGTGTATSTTENGTSTTSTTVSIDQALQSLTK